MIRNEVSLARSVELTAQWDRILGIGPVYRFPLEDLRAVRSSGIGEFLHCE